MSKVLFLLIPSRASNRHFTPTSPVIMVGRDWAQPGITGRIWAWVPLRAWELHVPFTPPRTYLLTLLEADEAGRPKSTLLLIQTMEDSNDGNLCQVCTETVQGKTLVDKREDWHWSNIKGANNPFDRAHHNNYSSFLNSKDQGCCICSSWLWASHAPPPPTSSNVDDFRIFSRVDAYSGVNLYLCVTCPWAADSELHGTPSGFSVERYRPPRCELADLSYLPSVFGEGPESR
jgi:hypothetical protein